MAIEFCGGEKLLVRDWPCWKCSEPIRLIALYGETGLGPMTVNTWGASWSAELEAAVRKVGSHVEFHADVVEDDAEEGYWANQCPSCGAIQGDWYLFDEPGGAFFPLPNDECPGVEVWSLWPGAFDWMDADGWGCGLEWLTSVAVDRGPLILDAEELRAVDEEWNRST